MLIFENTTRRLLRVLAGRHIMPFSLGCLDVAQLFDKLK